MKKDEQFLLWFDQLEREDVAIVGGKSSSLGEMTSKTDVPVPYGFATTAFAYRYFLEKNGLKERINETLRELTDIEDSALLRETCRKIREMIVAEKMPEELEGQIKAAYQLLASKVGQEEPFVAVRSSATAEDLPDASFAGQQDTYLNVHGGDEVVERVKQCYASCFTDRAVYYREKQGFDHSQVELSAAIQMMVFSEASGVMFTLNVTNGHDDVVFIEASYGLGEYVVQGNVTPDNYQVEKATGSIIVRDVYSQEIMLVRKPGGDCEEMQVPDEKRARAVLTDAQILELSRYALAIEKHYGCYMDMEWGIDERDGKIWILQARPETVWSRKKKQANMAAGNYTVLAKGMPASPGRVSGKAHVIRDVARIDEFRDGEILITEMTAPDWVPAMKKAKAIVTNSGGMTCHASIVSRELGIPCVVGTKSRGIAITDVVKDGMEISVDASNGIVYEGLIDFGKKKEESEGTSQTVTVAESFPVTGTKIYMNLGDPDLAEKYSLLPCDGIGLMREEFIWTTYIHEHPLWLIKQGQPEKVVDMLADAVLKVCRPMSPRPVVLRFSDFKSSEYRDLTGGDEFEPIEPSALLGWRGASRYYDPKYSEAFRLECRAVRKVREEYGMKNLYVMIPFCRTVDECRKVLAIMEEEGLKRSNDFKVWLMAEIPSNIILADMFNEYIDGYSIGSNDLTMLTLGCDRDNDTVSHIFDERDPAVRRFVKKLIDTAHAAGKTVSICGQAPSVYPEFAEFLVRCGIDSMSVNPDMVKQTKKSVAQVEQRIMLDALTGKGRVLDQDMEW